MAKGNPNLVAGPGRPKGVPNKFTMQLKEMILGALDDAGGRVYLCQQAQDNPGPFLALVGKVLPMTLVGDKDNPLTINTTIQPADKDLINRYLAQKEPTHDKSE